MTNSSPSSAAKRVSAALLAALLAAGCGKNDGSAAYREGEAAFAERDFTAAAEAFRETLQCAPGNVDALVMLARAELGRGELAQAAQAIAEAKALAGDDQDVIELEGQIAFQREDFAAARAAFTRLATAKAADAAVASRGYAGLGVIDYARIRNETLDESAARARTEFLTAIRLDARNASAHYHLGRLYADVYHYPAIAASELGLFVYLSPKEDPRARRAQKLVAELQTGVEAELARRPGAGKRNPSACATALAKGDAAFAKGQLKAARLAYAEAYAADVMSFPAALGQARCADTLKEALAYYKAAVEIRPSSGATFVALGDTALKAGRPAIAEEAFSRALAASPKDGATLARLISTLRRNGKTRVAEVYQRYAETLPARKRQ